MHLDECGIDPILAKIDQVCHKIDKKILTLFYPFDPIFSEQRLNKVMENLKDIPGYEGLYAASENGGIWSYKAKRFLNANLCDKGYARAFLRKDGKGKMYRVHRLIWLTFKGEIPYNKEINHIDCNRRNNKLSNLECVSHVKNMQHPPTKSKLGAPSQPFCLISEKENIYCESIRDAADKMGMSRGSVIYQLHKAFQKGGIFYRKKEKFKVNFFRKA